MENFLFLRFVACSFVIASQFLVKYFHLRAENQYTPAALFSIKNIVWKFLVILNYIFYSRKTKIRKLQENWQSAIYFDRKQLFLTENVNFKKII